MSELEKPTSKQHMTSTKNYGDTTA